MTRTLAHLYGRRNPPLLFVGPTGREQADLFWDDLFGNPVAVEFDTEGDDLRSWPTLATLPDSLNDQIIANRNRVRTRASEIRLAPGGYYALGQNIAPSVIRTPEEDRNPRLSELINRLDVEVAGEGRTS